MLNKYFPDIFCINLDRRVDRMEYFRNIASFYDFKYTRVSGVDGNKITEFNNPHNLPYFSRGDVGCTLSHLKVVKHAKEANLPFYLVLEDDINPRLNLNELLKEYMPQLPLEWDLVYFGVNLDNSVPLPISDNVVKISKGYTTHAIAVKETMYDTLIEKWSSPVKNVDVLLSELHSEFNVYAFQPNLIGQKAGHSDILGRDVNYDFLLK